MLRDRGGRAVCQQGACIPSIWAQRCVCNLDQCVVRITGLHKLRDNAAERDFHEPMM